MQSSCLREVIQVCPNGCCPSPVFCNMSCLPKQDSKRRSATSNSRHDFAAKTALAFFPNTQFTNHESLTSFQESLSQFNKAYPNYSETDQVDKIRATEYYHLSLSNHVCLDYIGVGLFSQFQLQHHYSTSSGTSDVPFFSLSYKSADLKTQLLNGGDESELESLIKKRIMEYLSISENDYSMVLTANRTSAFKILAESYPFQKSRKLLTVYDYASEAVEGMIHCSEKRGAKPMSAEFKWPRLKINSAKLKKMLVRKKKENGLFVFPVQSRMSGARYPYLWMRTAQENGWRVLLDACALGPKDMDCLGLSVFRPDFIICSFYKIFGENPSGFGCLLVKKSTVPFLETSVSAGIVNLVPDNKLFQFHCESSGTDTELDQTPKSAMHDDLDSQCSSSGHFGIIEQGETSERHKNIRQNKNLQTICNGLDHVDALGLSMISNRARYLVNWLVNALMKLQHPSTVQKRIPLVEIYGPKIKFDRAPALAFNMFDWKGDKVDPVLVQKLADRNNISLSYGFLHQIWFPDKYQAEKERVMERRETKEKGKRKDNSNLGITVVTAALGFLANFEDIYRLWDFLAQFLDADFVEKERWRYIALNQKTVEI